MTNMLLNYAVATNPQPLQSGSAQGGANGVVSIYVSQGAQAVYANRLVIKPPSGLFLSAPTVSLSTNKWALEGLEARAKETPQLDATSIILISLDPGKPIDYNFVIELRGAIGSATTYNIEIDESTSLTPNPPKYNLNNWQYGVSVTSPEFYLKNFMAYGPGGPGAPMTEFENGAAVTLTWESNGTYFQVYRKGEGKPFYAGTGKVAPIPANQLATSTTYLLVASMTGDPAHDQPTPGYAPIYLYDSLALTVRNPDLTPKTVNATGVIHGVGICPAGTVIMFTGNTGDPTRFDGSGKGVAGTQYEGWQVCNGSNGAPDLRDRFIVGAGSSYNLNDTGGAVTVTLTEAQMPSHNHGGSSGSTAPYLTYPGVQYCTQGVTTGVMVNVQTEDPNGNRPNELSTRGQPDLRVQDHTHSIAPDGGSQPHENRPPYYALAYLMKL